MTSPEFMKYILPKGFVAVDGCSLTVGEVGDVWFSVYLIPETIRCGPGLDHQQAACLRIPVHVNDDENAGWDFTRVTVFSARKEGDYVNIEVDSQTQVNPLLCSAPQPRWRLSVPRGPYCA